ncbi:hypothetical protein MMC25_005823 [Agyrium rufum]|nr:hypothetical protein [Agyrium rufum]
MQSISILGALLFAISTPLISAQIVTITAQGFGYDIVIPGAANPSESSAIVSDVSNYLATVPSATSVNSVLATAIPSGEGAITESNYQITTQTWFTALPSDVQSYVVSVESVVASIETKDLSAAAPPRPTGGSQLMMGAAAAMGAVGVVAAALA